MIRKQTWKVIITGILGLGILQFGKTALAAFDIDAPASVEFGDVVLGTGNLTKPVSFTNNRTEVMTFSVQMEDESLNISKDFEVEPLAQTTLNPGETVTINVRLKTDSSEFGQRKGRLSALFTSPGTIVGTNISVSANVVGIQRFAGGGLDAGCQATPSSPANPASWAGLVLFFATLGLVRWAFRKNQATR